MVSAGYKQSHARRWLAEDADINIGLMDRLFDDLYRLGGLRRIHITGGEPLLFNKISLALFLMRRNFPDAEIALVTNGILLEQFADKLAKTQINRVSISLNAADKESYARQCRTKMENFEKVRAGVKALRKERDKNSSPLPHITLTAVLDKENFRGVEKMLKLGIDAGADAVTYLALMDCPAAGEAEREFILNQTEFSEFLKEMEKLKPLAEKNKIYLGFNGNISDQGRLRAGELYKKVPCYAGYSFAMIWPDGTVRPCCNCDTILGNLSEQSFYSIWTSQRTQEIRDRMLRISEQGAPESCDCLECGYLYENQEFHRLVSK